LVDNVELPSRRWLEQALSDSFGLGASGLHPSAQAVARGA
jgi:hypothetical protein